MLVQSIRWSIESHLYTEYMYVLKLLCHRLAHINYSIRPSIRAYRAPSNDMAAVAKPPGRLGGLSVFYSESFLCGSFVRARGALNSQQRRPKNKTAPV